MANAMLTVLHTLGLDDVELRRQHGGAGSERAPRATTTDKA